MIAQGTELKFIGNVGKSRDKHIVGRYLCFCGNEFDVINSRVRKGYTRSCGCLIGTNIKHGLHGTPTYDSWRSAKDRTLNKTSKDYPRYGGAGITFSPKWISFEEFVADMGERPRGTTLDRIDGSKGYEPGNCRWATPTEQARNRKDFTIIKSPYGVMPLVDYAKVIGITTGAAHMRLRRGKLDGCTHA